MEKILKRMKLHVWLACLAILFNALAPSLSHALAMADNKSGWQEICSTTGSKFVATDQGKLISKTTKTPADKVTHHLQHCPYCSSHAASFILPATDSMRFAIAGGQAVYPSLFYQSPSPLFSWSRANPRAPPQFS
ncbi:DUF2946 domain-containing protein [Undibacterium sp. TJN19]|uniref:DUF2946 domain-containing protein n=1 Tax=Undibacterium sp. TJN19 TaxID=3413055 RepID=UPI003BEFE894